MKKPVCRNADKALCAYFTYRGYAVTVGKPQGTRFGLQLGKVMIIQLQLDFTPRPPANLEPTFNPHSWVDVSAIAVGVGLDQPVFVSVALSDVFEEGQAKMDSDYDQRLYDALWYAHFVWSLNEGRPVCIPFSFPSKHSKAGDICEISLRLRLEKRSYGMLLGLLEDF